MLAAPLQLAGSSLPKSAASSAALASIASQSEARQASSVAVPAVAQVVLALDLLAELRPQVLVDVGLAGEAAEVADVVEVVEQVTEAGSITASAIGRQVLSMIVGPASS